MKRSGSVLDFKARRNHNLLRVFRRCLADSSYVFLPRIFAMVADSPAERFWVSEERATVVISAMFAGKPLPRMRPNKIEMFQEIFHRTLEIRNRHPQRSIRDIVAEVVNQPAPKFYLTPRTVGEYIFCIKSGRYDH